MKRSTTRLALTASILVGLVPSSATAQSDEDWEFAEDAARNLSIAAVRYENGTSVVVQCVGEELKVGLVGLPATTATSRRLQASRTDGATDAQVWQSTGQGTLASTLPGRDARFLRADGEFTVRSAAGEAAPVTASFTLPSQHANLDRVISACGYAVEDERDSIPRADPDLRMQRRLPEGSTGGVPGRSMEVSCIIKDGAYQECRSDQVRERQTASSARREANRWNGRRVHENDAAANEGRVAYIFVPLLMVVG
jgi:hypothetical protein